MKRIAAILAVAALVASGAPAFAQALGPSAIGAIFCVGVTTHDMKNVMAWMTPDLAEKVAAVTAAKGADAIRWVSTPGADHCMPVGAQGTAEVPESILYYTWSNRSHPGFSDNLVLRFVADEARIDDIKFADGTTLRQQLAAD